VAHQNFYGKNGPTNAERVIGNCWQTKHTCYNLGVNPVLGSVAHYMIAHGFKGKILNYIVHSQYASAGSQRSSCL